MWCTLKDPHKAQDNITHSQEQNGCLQRSNEDLGDRDTQQKQADGDFCERERSKCLVVSLAFRNQIRVTLLASPEAILRMRTWRTLEIDTV